MKTVVILLSDKRSGSTMFQRELCRHPGISHVDYTPHSNFETHHWLKGAVMLDLPASDFSGGQRYRGYGPVANARTYMLDCVTGNVPGYATTLEGKALVFDAWDALCERYAQPVFFEKSPQHLAHWASISLLLEWAAGTSMDVKIIGLTRNPMAVMYSARELFHTPPHKRQHGWMAIQQNMLRLRELLPVDGFMHCRYEDIMEHPGDAFAQVAQFIGVAPDPACGSGVTVEAQHRWRQDPGFRLVLDDEVAEFAQQFGYGADDLHNPHGDSSSTIGSGITQGLRLLPSRLRDRIITPLRLGRKQRD